MNQLGAIRIRGDGGVGLLVQDKKGHLTNSEGLFFF